MVAVASGEPLQPAGTEPEDLRAREVGSTGEGHLIGRRRQGVRPGGCRERVRVGDRVRVCIWGVGRRIGVRVLGGLRGGSRLGGPESGRGSSRSHEQYGDR